MTAHSTRLASLRPGGLYLLPLLILIAVLALWPATSPGAEDPLDTWTLDILAQSDSRAELRPCT